MRAAVKLIAGADRIHVLAQRRAFPVAGYLAYALGQLELKTHLLDGAGGMLGENLRSIASDDVLLVASFRSYSPEVVHAAQACSSRGVPVIAITDGPLSPLLEPARVCFELAVGLFQAVPLAGCAAVPGAGAGHEHGPPARREAGPRPPGRHANDLGGSTSSAWAVPRSTSMATRSAGGWRTCRASASTWAALRPTRPSGSPASGLKPAMLTRVGDEHNGRFVRETLAAEGVDTSHVKTDPEAPHRAGLPRHPGP